MLTLSVLIISVGDVGGTIVKAELLVLLAGDVQLHVHLGRVLVKLHQTIKTANLELFFFDLQR